MLNTPTLKPTLKFPGTSQMTTPLQSKHQTLDAKPHSLPNSILLSTPTPILKSQIFDPPDPREHAYLLSLLRQGCHNEVSLRPLVPDFEQLLSVGGGHGHEGEVWVKDLPKTWLSEKKPFASDSLD
jgi:hypothetical protein